MIFLPLLMGNPNFDDENELAPPMRISEAERANRPKAEIILIDPFNPPKPTRRSWLARLFGR